MAHQSDGDAWRRLDRFGLSAGVQMGLDEALLLHVGRPERPTLSFYTWDPPALSLGFFQRLEDVPAARSLPTVRRLTGGKAIHHADELTFSLAAPLDHPLYAGALADGYARVHRAVARGLRNYGVEAQLRDSRALASDRAGTGMCFHESSPLDLAWAGPGGLAKGLGSAQRRSRGRLLHHGSIKLGRPAFEEGVACVADIHPGPLDPREVAEALALAFADELGLQLEADEPTAAERVHAHAREAFFGSPEFLSRKPEALDAARRPPKD